MLSFNFFIKPLSHPQNEEVPSTAYTIFVYYGISKQSGKYAGLTRKLATLRETRVRQYHCKVNNQVKGAVLAHAASCSLTANMHTFCEIQTYVWSGLSVTCH